MARSIWNGAISFGLVHIPVELVSATSSTGIDFDWLDQRTMDPVGYKRINKVTGKEVTTDHIVKGIQYEKGKYILLDEEEIRSAHPKSTQTIDIFSFVDHTDIPLVHIDTPYFLSPGKRGEKVYALLRETLSTTGKVGLAHVVLHTKQHLSAVMAIDSALVLVLLRWPSEVRPIDIVELPDEATQANLNKDEKNMAKRLVEDMKGKWEPDNYHDTFQEKIMALVDKKVREGKIEDVETEIETSAPTTADIIDLTELLRRSLRGEASPARKARNTTDSPSPTSTKAKSRTTPNTKKSARPAKHTTTKKSSSATTTERGSKKSRTR